MSEGARRTMPWAGLAAGPLAWAVNTQAGYALVPWICASKLNLVPVIALAMAALASAGALVSWRAAAPGAAETAGGGTPHRFVAALGALAGMLFALVILTQGAAALILTGCER